MMSLRALLATLFLLATADAFVPMGRIKDSCAAAVTAAQSKSKLNFGFLKDLGLEKPSWLPDFGGKQSEEPVAEMTESVEGETESESVEE